MVYDASVSQFTKKPRAPLEVASRSESAAEPWPSCSAAQTDGAEAMLDSKDGADARIGRLRGIAQTNGFRAEKGCRVDGADARIGRLHGTAQTAEFRAVKGWAIHAASATTKKIMIFCSQRPIGFIFTGYFRVSRRFHQFPHG